MRSDQLIDRSAGDDNESQLDAVTAGIPVEIVPPKLNRHQRRALAAKMRIEERKRKKANRASS